MTPSSEFILTCFAVGDDYIREMEAMVASFRRFYPSVPVVLGYNPYPRTNWGSITCRKPDWILKIHRTFNAPVLWVDADARFRAPLPPFSPRTALGLRRYGRGTKQHWATGVVYAPRYTDVLLVGWKNAPGDTDEEKLRKLEIKIKATDYLAYDLGPSVSDVCSRSVNPANWDGTVPPSSIVQWNLSRKIHYPDFGWPPSETTRANARVRKETPRG